MVQREGYLNGETGTSLTLRNAIVGLNRYSTATLGIEIPWLWCATINWSFDLPTAHDRWCRVTALKWDFASGDGSVGVVNADGTSSSLAYDQVGRLASVRDEIGRVLGYGYDVLDRLTTATDAGGGATVFGYALAGRVRRQVLPDGTTVLSALGAGGYSPAFSKK